MAHYRASEGKREQFRKYLERSGVLDSLTTVLVTLYERSDKPSNALDFIKVQLGAAGPEPVTEALLQELAELKKKCAELQEENEKLKDRLLQYEPTPEEGAVE